MNYVSHTTSTSIKKSNGEKGRDFISILKKGNIQILINSATDGKKSRGTLKNFVSNNTAYDVIITAIRIHGNDQGRKVTFKILGLSYQTAHPSQIVIK